MPWPFVQTGPNRTGPHLLGEFDHLIKVGDRPTLNPDDLPAVTFWALHALRYRTVRDHGTRKSPSERRVLKVVYSRRSQA